MLSVTSVSNASTNFIALKTGMFYTALNRHQPAVFSPIVISNHQHNEFNFTPIKAFAASARHLIHFIRIIRSYTRIEQAICSQVFFFIYFITCLNLYL